MVPTFLIDWPVLIFIGLLFGYGVKGTPPRGVWRTRGFISGLIVMVGFVGLVYLSYRIAPDWMFMYFVPSREIPRWTVGVLLVLYFSVYLAGFFLKFILEGIRTWLPPLLLFASLVASGVVILPLKERYLKVGTYEEYQRGEAVALSESAIARGPGRWSMVLFPLGGVLLFWSRRKRVL